MNRDAEFAVPSLLLFQIGALYGIMHKECAKIFRAKSFPLEMDQIPVLLVLYYKGEASQQEICSDLQRDKASVNRTISFLLKKDMVKVIPDASDKRKTRVGLTPTGKKLAKQAELILAEFDALLSLALTKDEKKQFHNAMLKLIGNINIT